MNDAADVKEEFLLRYHPDLRVCNCGSCGDLLVSEWERERHAADCKAVKVGLVWVRKRGKPYCRGCVASGSVPAGVVS